MLGITSRHLHTVFSGDTQLEDTQDHLLRSAQQGSKHAFARLWETHFVSVVRGVTPLAHGEAEDIASEAFLITWEQLRRGEGPQQNFRAYVCGVAKNLARQHYRNYRQKVTAIVSEDLDALAPPAPCSESLRVRAEESEQLHATLCELPARWREVLHLQHIEQISRNEIGSRFGMSVNAVSALSRRARLGLKTGWLEVERLSH